MGGRAGNVVPIGDHVFVVPCFEATSTMLGIVVFSAVSKQIVFQLALLTLQTLQFKLSFLNFPVTQLALQLAFTSSCGDIVASWSVIFSE